MATEMKPETTAATATSNGAAHKTLLAAMKAPGEGRIYEVKAGSAKHYVWAKSAQGATVDVAESLGWTSGAVTQKEQLAAAKEALTAAK